MYTLGGVTALDHESSSQTYYLCRTQEAALDAYALAIAVEGTQMQMQRSELGPLHPACIGSTLHDAVCIA